MKRKTTPLGRQGFSLIEIMIAVALIAIIAGITIMTANPFGQIASARNKQRELHLEAVMNAIRQNIADTTTGSFSCSSGSVPTTTKKMATGAGNYNIGPCLVPSYILSLPFDPGAAGAHYVSISDYDTGYNIVMNTSSQITVSAPSAELGKTISITR